MNIADQILLYLSSSGTFTIAISLHMFVGYSWISRTLYVFAVFALNIFQEVSFRAVCWKNPAFDNVHMMFVKNTGIQFQFNHRNRTRSVISNRNMLL